MTEKRKEKCPCSDTECFIILPPISVDESNSYETPCGRIAYWYLDFDSLTYKLSFLECEAHGFPNRQFPEQAKPVCTCE